MEKFLYHSLSIGMPVLALIVAVSALIYALTNITSEPLPRFRDVGIDKDGYTVRACWDGGVDHYYIVPPQPQTR